MKSFFLACAIALASVAVAPFLCAQQISGQITIQDPAEFNAYQSATSHTQPAARAASLEEFLTHYPQSAVKKTVLAQLIDEAC
jgi:hypothetical protein